MTGNTVIDAFQYTVKDGYKFHDKTLVAVNFDNKRIVVITAHRRENLGEPLLNICRALRSLAEEYPKVLFIYPVHLNPVVRETVFSVLADVSNMLLIDPIDVLDMHNLLARSLYDYD